jgi:hypothetical protein
MNDPGGRERMLKLGTRSLPLLARGSEFIVCQSLADVAKFVSITDFTETKLPADVLMAKWQKVMTAAQRYMRQFPTERLEERIHPARDQSIRHMGYHVFHIGHAFLGTVVDGVEDWIALAMEDAPAELRTGADIAQYGETMKKRLDDWWRAQGDKSCSAPVKTLTGVQPVCDFLLRQTWHSAQHVRQLAYALEQMGIVPDGPLGDEELGSLPLPERLWE